MSGLSERADWSFKQLLKLLIRPLAKNNQEMSQYISDEFVKNSIAELNNQNGWKLEIQNDRVSLYVNSHMELGDGESVQATKVIANKISIPFAGLVRVLQEKEHRVHWDSSHVETNHRTPIRDDEDLIYNCGKSPNRLLFSSRDFVIARKMIKETTENNKHVVYFVGKSVEDPKHPPTKGHVRAKVNVQVTRIEELNDKECSIQFLSSMNMGGSIPSFVKTQMIKKLAEEFGDGFQHGYQYIQKLK